MGMKKIIKALILTICLLLTVPMIVLNIENVRVEAASKVKLSCTKKTIECGEKFKLKLIGTNKKVKWYSSNKGIASVTSKGIVKGVGKGTANITASVGRKKYVCKVKVKEREKPQSIVTYLSDRSVEYVSNEDLHRFFFSLKNQNMKRVSSSGTVDIRIENAGAVVYKKIVKFSPDNFAYWTNRVYGERYLCSIDIPISDIKPGKSNQGTLYYTVSANDASFDEFSLNIYDLPEKTAVFNLPSLPYSTFESVTIKNGFTGRYERALCDINIDSITTKMQSSYVDLNITGSVTPSIESITWGGSNYYHFTVKLIKDGVVVDSNMVMTPSIYLNDKFSCKTTFFDIDNTSEYTIEICSYD